MKQNVFVTIGEQLRRWREQRGLSQPELAQRVGRNRARISELERDLLGSRWGRDRLTLFAEICDALDLVPVLVPRAQANAALHQFSTPRDIEFNRRVQSAFEELFVDLSEDEGEAR